MKSLWLVVALVQSSTSEFPFEFVHCEYLYEGMSYEELPENSEKPGNDILIPSNSPQYLYLSNRNPQKATCIPAGEKTCELELQSQDDTFDDRFTGRLLISEGQVTIISQDQDSRRLIAKSFPTRELEMNLRIEHPVRKTMAIPEQMKKFTDDSIVVIDTATLECNFLYPASSK